ncbi:MAG TPA: tripartite tricarboxylate transporter TctB family protein [Burkholderiaceae bacterium]|nr:tripartite tricarboxylate transporter TctB family protein [Burkholderiaceae bacterium]
MPDPHSNDAQESPAVVRNNTMDAIVAAVLFAVGAVVIVEARRLGAGWTDDGPGSGYFPFYIGLVICFASLGVFYQAMFSKRRDSGVFVDREQLGRVASVLLPAFAFVFAIAFIGVYVASAIYIAAFMIVLGKYPPAKAVFLGLAVSAFFFLMFEVWFKVPLYKGRLDPLGFLGY